MNGADIFNRINDLIVNPLILLVFAAGFTYFMWGLVMFMWNVESDEAKKTGVNHMLWGLAGMLIMISVWGIIAMINNTLGLSPDNTDVNRAQDVGIPNIF